MHISCLRFASGCKPLLARSEPRVPALVTHARVYSSRSRSRMQNDYSWYGEQAHATTILSVRKDNQVVRSMSKAHEISRADLD